MHVSRKLDNKTKMMKLKRYVTRNFKVYRSHIKLL